MKISFSLIKTLLIEDINKRYKSSILGLAWSFITPLLQLALFTFVFGVILKTKWSVDAENHSIFDFSIILFAGLVIFQYFAEILSKSCGLLFEHEYLVKKVVFPLEILPVVVVISACFHLLIAIFGIILIQLIDGRDISFNVIYVPFVLLSVIPISLGIVYLLSALGIFIRDLSHFINLIIPGLLFLSPIFYSITILPEWLKPFMFFNPVVFPVEELRNILLFSKSPNYYLAIVNIIYGMVIFVFGYFFFTKTKKGFADVI